MNERQSRFPAQPETVVVPFGDIPLSTAPEDAGVEARPFSSHQALGSLIPPSNVALAWIRARFGQEVTLRSHAKPRLLTVLRGHADLTGRVVRHVKAGDVVTLPSHHEYGFASIGEDGLHALTVDFVGGGQRLARQTLTLEDLLARNEMRARNELGSSFFRLVSHDSLDPRRRAALRDGLRVFSDAFQTILLTRQATCRDERYTPAFLEHFREELGHNDLLVVSGDRRAAEDPVLRATSSWFCHQMLVLDNAGKAALVHLVLETAGYHFHTIAKSRFSTDVSREYFEMHAEADEDHMGVAVKLLEGQHPDVYARLQQVVDTGWDMFHAVTERIAQLVEIQAESS